MNTKNNRRSQETRERVRQALVELLGKEDILDITVSRLCAEAGINRTTFYSHYDSVADIMEELMVEIGKDLLARFEGPRYDERNLFSFEHLVIVLEHIRENKNFYRAYLGQSTAQRQLDWAFGQLLEKFIRPMMQRLHVEDSATLYYFAFFRAGFTETIALWLRGGCAEEPETIAGYMEDLLNHPAVTDVLHDVP